ncbi:IS3 family transposase [Nocardia abscessus]|uniref:IS3 family transposase n=1 Tax=Nocardia abscessus TaxID=120957 RepID=UPI001892FC62|nr:IS3 family transposase [Nocardia abscessus]MBF6341060.1 IS3 family transposase [Nocardia abscessus]
MAAEGLPVQPACRLLGVAESGYYEWKKRSPSQRELRHAFLLEQIRAIHAASRGTYGAMRVHAELTLGRGPWSDRAADVPRGNHGPAGQPATATETSDPDSW